MTKLSDNYRSGEPRWAVRIERRDERQRTRQSRERKRDRMRGFRVFMMSTFLFHAFTYGVVMVMLFLLNILTWNGMLWMAFPAVGWGAFLAIHGALTWTIANAGMSTRMVSRAQQPLPVVSKATPDESELAKIIARDLAKVDEMRAIARNMRTASARRNGMEAVNSIENTLIALEDQPDELPLAREFSGAFVEPAHRIFIEYDRLSQREIQSALPILNEVEQNDLPRITARAAEMHERVHRGTLIDLAVAREMLDLGQTSAISAP